MVALQAVDDFIPIASFTNQSGALQNTEMSRNGRACDIEPAPYLSGRQRSLAQIGKDLPSGWIGQGFEDIAH